MFAVVKSSMKNTHMFQEWLERLPCKQETRVSFPAAPSLLGRGYWQTLVIQLLGGPEVIVGEVTVCHA